MIEYMRLLVFKKWLPLAVVTTLLSGMLFGAVQQLNRQEADDLPVQLAQDIADRMYHQVKAQSLVGSVDIEMGKSLAPFVIVLDKQDKIVVSSAALNGKKVLPPTGAITWAREHGEHRLTWEPAAGVRSAIVIIPVHDAEQHIVIAGHSLREVESRMNAIQWEIVLGWLVTLVASFGAMWFVDRPNS